MSAPKPGSHVYFARCFTARGMDMGAIKIGCSYHVPDRLKSVDSAQPYDCALIGSVPGTLFEEAVAHLWLRPYRIGGEYFHDDPAVMDFVTKAVATGEFPLPVRVARDHYPTMDEARFFMLRHGLTLADLSAVSGKKTSYASHMKNDTHPNRRMVAAMMVAALRKGHRIAWPKDLSYIEAEAA